MGGWVGVVLVSVVFVGGVWVCMVFVGGGVYGCAWCVGVCGMGVGVGVGGVWGVGVGVCKCANVPWSLLVCIRRNS